MFASVRVCVCVRAPMTGLQAFKCVVPVNHTRHAEMTSPHGPQISLLAQRETQQTTQPGWCVFVTWSRSDCLQQAVRVFRCGEVSTGVSLSLSLSVQHKTGVMGDLLMWTRGEIFQIGRQPELSQTWWRTKQAPGCIRAHGVVHEIIPHPRRGVYVCVCVRSGSCSPDCVMSERQSFFIFSSSSSSVNHLESDCPASLKPVLKWLTRGEVTCLRDGVERFPALAWQEWTQCWAAVKMMNKTVSINSTKYQSLVDVNVWKFKNHLFQKISLNHQLTAIINIMFIQCYHYLLIEISFCVQMLFIDDWMTQEVLLFWRTRNVFALK